MVKSSIIYRCYQSVYPIVSVGGSMLSLHIQTCSALGSKLQWFSLVGRSGKGVVSTAMNLYELTWMEDTRHSTTCF